MRFRHLLAACICLATALPAGAQSLSRNQGPVNFPPSSFTGTQFVDNRGCIYIRAGFQGAVSWVPRVGRDRRVICGQQPTFSGASAPATTAAPAPQPTPAPAQPRQTAVAEAESRPAAPRRSGLPAWMTRTPSPADGPSIVSRPAQEETRGRSAAVTTVREAPVRTLTTLPETVRPAPVVAPAPVPVATRPQMVQPAAPAQQPRRVTRVCPNRSGVSAQHTNVVGVRCGPQAEDPKGQGGTLAATERTAGTALIEDIRSTFQMDPAVLRIEGAVAPIPRGYEPVFKDGRHNPNRGLPGGVASLHANSGVHAVSARGHRPFVQAATFASASNAQATVRRLSSMGLPVATQTVRRGGRTLTVVLAGPFSDASTSARALQQVRAAGFRDAFPRR